MAVVLGADVQQQLDALITRGVDVAVLSAIDPKALRPSVESARRAGIPVVAHDRLAQGPVSGYVTFDGATIGRLQGRTLFAADDSLAGAVMTRW